MLIILIIGAGALIGGFYGAGVAAVILTVIWVLSALMDNE